MVATEASVSFERRALTNEEAEKLIQAASVRPVAEYRRTHPNVRPEVLAKLEQAGWVRGTYYLLAIECGWRRQEMEGTTWADLRLDDPKPSIRVRASTEGNKAKKEAWLLLPDVVAARLREHRARLRKRGPVALTDLVLPVPRHLVENMRKDAAYAGLGEVERTSKKAPAGNYSRGARWVDPEGAFVKLDVHALRTSFGTRASGTWTSRSGTSSCDTTTSRRRCGTTLGWRGPRWSKRRWPRFRVCPRVCWRTRQVPPRWVQVCNNGSKNRGKPMADKHECASVGAGGNRCEARDSARERLRFPPPPDFLCCRRGAARGAFKRRSVSFRSHFGTRCNRVASLGETASQREHVCAYRIKSTCALRSRLTWSDPRRSR